MPKAGNSPENNEVIVLIWQNSNRESTFYNDFLKKEFRSAKLNVENQLLEVTIKT